MTQTPSPTSAAGSLSAQRIGLTDAQLQVASFVAFTEGPCYSSDGSVYFTDLLNNRILRFVLKSQYAHQGGWYELVRSPAGRANGMVFDLQGRLLACEGAQTGGGRRISRTELDGSITVLADRYQGKRLNSPNDVDIDSKGRIYFTDPRYTERDDMELDHESVYRIDLDGTLTRIIDDVVRPNGLAVSIDQMTLYVVDTNHLSGPPRKVWSYPLQADGSVGARTLFHDFGTGRGADGMCLDEHGNLYITAGLNTASATEDASVPAGVYVFSPDGMQLGVIRMPQDMVTNCCFGDADLRTLYVTCGATLFYVRLNVRGHVLWPRLTEAVARAD